MAPRRYPLEWPAGWPRTGPGEQRRSAFKASYDQAIRNLHHQLALLGAENVVVSSNVAVRQDGQPYADAARRKINDPGVAVYFTLRGQPLAMARDAYWTVFENVHAVGHCIEHIRGVERHGGAFMMQRAFHGFTALPAPDWREALGFESDARPDLKVVKARYRELVKKHHPDIGGDKEEFLRITRGFHAAERELGGA